MFDVIIIGGGAHGVITALYLHSENDALHIAIFEKAKKLLPFYVEGEQFPFGNQTLPKAALQDMVTEKGISVFKSSAISALSFTSESDAWEIKTRRAVYSARKVIISSGKDPGILAQLNALGIATEETQVAAFPLESDDQRLVALGQTDIPVLLSWVKIGPSIKKIRIKLASVSEEKPLKQLEGHIRVHSGKISGPVVYQITQYITAQQPSLPGSIKVCINWAPEYSSEGMCNYLLQVKEMEPRKTISRTPLFGLPGRMWSSLLKAAQIGREMKWEGLGQEQITELADQLTDMRLMTKPALDKTGMIAYKGGVLTSATDEHSESRIKPGLFFVGTVLSDQLTAVKEGDKYISGTIKTLAKKIALA
ncbi:MAG: NAD(P)/FAD-dependent oxidoreductase [Flavobacteriaceae bacterium]|nr:NAD(P)/FAD-dependent oxidoreductase [Flavobacteriaceae bacterium]MDH3795557.1 NAD(P)/FAD-dependent oxidoreductase [Flavobacteriaceae bacterium]